MTLGFDDGSIAADSVVIEKLREKDMKATFNLIGNNNYSDLETFYNTYRGMELASHSQTHFGDDIHNADNLTKIQNDIDAGVASAQEMINKVKQTYNYDFPALRGYVWPNHEPGSGTGIRDTMKTWLDNHTSIKYARGSWYADGVMYFEKASGDYSLPTLENNDTWTRWRPNSSINSIGENEINRFFNQTTISDTKVYPVLFYVWGHSSEVINENNTAPYTNFNKILAEFEEHDSEVWSATQGEIYDYTNALKDVTVTKNTDGTMTLKNNSGIIVYYRQSGTGALKSLSPNETVTY